MYPTEQCALFQLVHYVSQYSVFFLLVCSPFRIQVYCGKGFFLGFLGSLAKISGCRPCRRMGKLKYKSSDGYLKKSHNSDIKYVIQGHSIASSQSRNVCFCPDAAPQFQGKSFKVQIQSIENLWTLKVSKFAPNMNEIS